MLPLFDMIMRAQNGAAMDAMAKQFNLAQEQAAQAMAALLPAFSSGFKRSSTNPYDMSSLMSAMSSGNYGKYFEDVSKAFTPQGMMDGNAVLEKLFGSKEVSRAVAEQAAQLTGIGQDVLKKMMPAMADTLMGGLFKQMSGQLGQNNAFSPEAMTRMSEQWLQAIGFQPKPKPQADPFSLDNPMFQAVRSFWGLEKEQQQKTAGSSNPFLDNPFAKAFQDMMTAGLQPKPADETAQAKGQPEAPKVDNESFRTMLNSMFDTGVEVQKAYQKNMEALIEGYRRGSAGEPTKTEA